MKNIFKFSALLACLAMIGLVSCTQEELSTDQYNDGIVAFGAFGPNPVVRGDTLTILGSNLEKVTEVLLPGADPVTEFAEVVPGVKGQLKLVVPVAGPEDAPVTGVVTIVDNNGTEFSSTAELSYTEGIVISSFSPAEALPGDIVTIKGDYLYNTREVVFVSGNKDGKSYVTGEAIKATRYELKVAVPSDAISGLIMLGDVDETDNPDGLLPNTAYTASEIAIKDPSVTAFAKTTFKAGDAVEISGAYLNMIQTVKFVGADVDVADFTVAADAKKLTVALPAVANDGAVTAVSYAGKEFAAGEIETVRPSEMAVAAETRYKAGLNAIVTGKDLDLVTGVKVAGVDATFSTTADKTTVVIPAESADGDVVLSLANGNTVTAGAVEVVKPVIESLSVASVVAGDSLIVKGTDLDLVTAVAISEQPCEFKLEDKDIKVYVTRAAFTGDLVVTAANSSTSNAPIEVTYDESISITDMPSKIEVKTNFVFKGTNLGQVEAIFIDGVKVAAYTKRTDTELGFMLPDDITPGIYTLEFVLISGETLTWAVPFEVTGSYKLTTVWEAAGGQIDLTWGDPRPSVPLAAFEDLPKGSSLIFCFTQKDQTWGQIQINNGQWQGLVFPEVGSNTLVPTDYYGWEFAYREFEVQLTDDIIETIKAGAGDFNGVQTGVIIQGDGMYFNKIIIKSPSEPAETVLWEGEAIADDWANQPYVLSDAGLELIAAEAQAGQTVYFYVEQIGDELWKVQIVEGHWGPTYLSLCAFGADTESGKFTEYDLEANGGKIGLKLTQEILDAACTQQWWGGSFLLNGDNLKCTKITLQ